MKRFLKWAAVAVLIVLAIAILFPVMGPSSGSVRLLNLSNARRLAVAANLYAEAHGGKYPINLAEVVPVFVEASQWNELLFDARKDRSAPKIPNYEWHYFGAFFENSKPPPMLIASPQATLDHTKNNRLVVFADISADIVTEEKYQELLRKTIEAMRERFDTAKPSP